MPDASMPDAADAARAATSLAPVRAVGGIELRARAVAAGTASTPATRLSHLAERGGYRVKFPRPGGHWLEAVQLNTGGGIAGGDRIGVRVAAEAGSDLVFATQAPERIYRSLGPAADIAIALEVGAGARLDWLPQETLLYSGARARRQFDCDVAPTASLLMVEMITFGRIASGEVPGRGLLDDRWRVRRGGRLVFAEGLRLDGAMAGLLARPAIGAGARAFALVVCIAPEVADRLEALRSALAGARSVCGASAWNGMLVARLLAGDPRHVREDLAQAVAAVTGRALPRVWAV